MANLNGNSYSNFTSVGMFGGGVTSAGTGSSAGGFGFEMPDNVTFAYTCDGASPAVFTSAAAVTSQGAFVNGTPVSFVGSSGYFPYTVTAANPAVFTCPDITSAANGGGTLALLGGTVQLFGTGITGFTVSTPQQLGGAFPGVSVANTNYYISNISTNTFRLNATLTTGGISSSGGTAITALTAANTLQVTTVAPPSFASNTVYYMVSVSGNTFQLSATVGGSAINGGGTASAGMFQLMTITQTDMQIAYGTAGAQGALQGIVQNGWRVGLQPGQAVASASSLSLDENPQLMWQNVPGGTCQTGNADSIIVGGTQYTSAARGWGMVGGVSVTGAAGQYVDETKAPVMHVDDNGVPETAEHRKVRLTDELTGLKEKSSRTAKEEERMSVVQTALNELK